MNITVPIPDGLALKLEAADDGGLARRALEAFATEEYRRGRLTDSELRRLLGLDTRYALDGFLKARNVYLAYNGEDLERDRSDLARLGF